MKLHETNYKIAKSNLPQLLDWYAETGIIKTKLAENCNTEIMSNLTYFKISSIERKFNNYLCPIVILHAFLVQVTRQHFFHQNIAEFLLVGLCVCIATS